MRTLFFGTPALAVPYLDALHRQTQVQAVITSPDQPVGRGYDVQSPAVKVAAERLQLPVVQPERVKDAEFVNRMRDWNADLAVVVAYGKLLPPDVLAATRLGFINVHFSLLPAYRGAGPIQWALINGEAETGVTLFWLDPGMDTGPIFLQKRLAIGPDEDAEALRQRLIPLGVHALEEGLQMLVRGPKVARPQTGAISHAPLLTKADGQLNWNQPAGVLHNRIRGLTPWPGAFCFVQQGNSKVRLKVLQSRVWPSGVPGRPGTVGAVERGKSFVVRCSEGSLEVLTVQPEGKKPMPAWSWWQGARLSVGDALE